MCLRASVRACVRACVHVCVRCLISHGTSEETDEERDLTCSRCGDVATSRTDSSLELSVSPCGRDGTGSEGVSDCMDGASVALQLYRKRAKTIVAHNATKQCARTTCSQPFHLSPSGVHQRPPCQSSVSHS